MNDQGRVLTLRLGDNNLSGIFDTNLCRGAFGVPVDIVTGSFGCKFHYVEACNAIC